VTLQVRAPKLAEYKVGSPQPENSPSSMTYIETADVSVVSLEVPIPEYAPWSRCRRRHPAKCWVTWWQDLPGPVALSHAHSQWRVSC